MTFTLVAEGVGTRLRMEHAGFKGLKAFIVSMMMKGGWGKMLRSRVPAVIAQLDAGGDPQGADALKCDTTWTKRAWAHVIRLVPAQK